MIRPSGIIRRLRHRASCWVNARFKAERTHWTPRVLESWQVAVVKRVARCFGQHLYLVSAKTDAARPPKFRDREFYIARSRHAAACYHARGTCPPVPWLGTGAGAPEPYWLAVLGLTDDDPVEYMLAAFWSANGAVHVYEPAPRQDGPDDDGSGTSQACTSDGVEQ